MRTDRLGAVDRHVGGDAGSHFVAHRAHGRVVEK
jgi:hypothetical protein